MDWKERWEKWKLQADDAYVRADLDTLTEEQAKERFSGDLEFGTGCVKVTPAHDPNDYAMGLKHDLEVDVVIGLDGVMTESAGAGYTGLDRYAARKKCWKTWKLLRIWTTPKIILTL